MTKEKKALSAYMLYGRTLVNQCQKESCPVFICNTNPISFASEISGLDDEEQGAEMLSFEFYNTVKRERERIQGLTPGRGFRWSDLKAELDKCHPYFQKRTVEQVRNRFKYVKKEIGQV